MHNQLSYHDVVNKRLQELENRLGELTLRFETLSDIVNTLHEEFKRHVDVGDIDPMQGSISESEAKYVRR